MCPRKEIFEKVNFEKKSSWRQQKNEKLPSMQRVKYKTILDQYVPNFEQVYTCSDYIYNIENMDIEIVVSGVLLRIL